MRVAVAGSHNTGKSTLIAAFLERRPEYVHEPEAYEALADDVDLTSSEGPTLDGLASLLQYTMSVVASQAPGTRVIFERSPVDYLAYAAASRAAGTSRSSVAAFLDAHALEVRASVRHLDLIVLLPVSSQGPFISRADEDDRFRKRVDERLRRALIDDECDLFDGDRPTIVELSPLPERQLLDLIRLTEY